MISIVWGKATCNMGANWEEKMRESGRGREMREKHAKYERNARSESRRTARTKSRCGIAEAAGGGGGFFYQNMSYINTNDNEDYHHRHDDRSSLSGNNNIGNECSS